MKQDSYLDDGLKSKKRKAIEEAELLDKLRDKTKLDKSDYLALIIAGLTTIVPVVFLILMLYFLISMLVFG